VTALLVHPLDYEFVSAFLLEESDRLTLIDTGTAGKASLVIDEIRRIGRKPSDLRDIVLTHAHVDHTGSVMELAATCGSSVLAHALDAPVVRGEAEICSPILSDLERPYAEQAASRVVPAARCRVHRELQDGDPLDIGSGARVVHVPGHTPGSIAIHLRRERMLFCGDAVASLNGRPIVGFFNCHPEQAVGSFLRMAALDFDIAYFGHGQPLEADAASAFRRRAERLAQAPRD
jgi:glyoxylase-like metal-dependent hydrolase (beta-lactamase superfamily II)